MCRNYVPCFIVVDAWNATKPLTESARVFFFSFFLDGNIFWRRRRFAFPSCERCVLVADKNPVCGFLTRNVIPAGIVATARRLENDSFNFGILIYTCTRADTSRPSERNRRMAVALRDICLKNFISFQLENQNCPHTHTKWINTIEFGRIFFGPCM